MTEVRRAVADAWSEVLGVPAIEASDDFFTLGGESLGALRVCNRVGKVIGARVPLRMLYEESGFEAFTDRVENLRRDRG